MQKDDLISRQAALDALGERPVIWSYNDDYTLGERNQYDMDRLAIETVPPAQPRWIPVTERLPTENNSYLVWMPYTPEGHHITVAEWCGSYWNIKTPIMAWMPLPKPWEGAKDGKAD